MVISRHRRNSNTPQHIIIEQYPPASGLAGGYMARPVDSDRPHFATWCVDLEGCRWWTAKFFPDAVILATVESVKERY